MLGIPTKFWVQAGFTMTMLGLATFAPVNPWRPLLAAIGFVIGTTIAEIGNAIIESRSRR